MKCERECERGQVLPLVAVLLVLCGLGAVALGRLGERAADRARAQSAADAVALAGAVSGRADATRLAEANGARLTAFVLVDGDVRVSVVIRGATAWARARASPESTAGSSPAPAMRAALARAAQLLGSAVEVERVVPPGLLVEVTPRAVAGLVGVADQAGLCRSDPAREPQRFGLCPPPASALAGLDGQDDGE